MRRPPRRPHQTFERNLDVTVPYQSSAMRMVTLWQCLEVLLVLLVLQEVRRVRPLQNLAFQPPLSRAGLLAERDRHATTRFCVCALVMPRAFSTGIVVSLPGHRPGGIRRWGLAPPAIPQLRHLLHRKRQHHARIAATVRAAERSLCAVAGLAAGARRQQRPTRSGSHRHLRQPEGIRACTRRSRLRWRTISLDPNATPLS